MSKLIALLLSDGLPGHYNLAEGVIGAVGTLAPVEIIRIEVRRPDWMPPRILSGLLNAGLGPALILKWIYHLDPSALPRADLVVSAGGDTLAANVCATRLIGAPNIFYGSLRRYRAQDFRLVLTSYVRDARSPHRVRTLKPSPINPETIEPITGPTLLPAVAGLLIGGDAGTVRFTHSDWDFLMDLVRATHRQFGTRWIVSNSRRTPEPVSDQITAMYSEHDGPIVEFIDVRSGGTGALARLFKGSAAVVCTVDSSSMVSEAVWLRRPLVTVSPADFALPHDESLYRAYLHENGWCRELTLAKASPTALIDALRAITPLKINPRVQLGQIIAREIPELVSKAGRAPL